MLQSLQRCSRAYKNCPYKSFVCIYNKSLYTLHNSCKNDPSNFFDIDPKRFLDDITLHLREIWSHDVADKNTLSTELIKSVTLHATVDKANKYFRYYTA